MGDYDRFFHRERKKNINYASEEERETLNVIILYSIQFRPFSGSFVSWVTQLPRLEKVLEIKNWCTVNPVRVKATNVPIERPEVP